MLSSDIKNLKSELETRQAAFQNSQIDTSKEDEMLANLANTTGWEVLKASINKTINDLLEPGIGRDDNADLQTIGAITLAREFTIDALQNIISRVENAKLVKISDNQENSPVEEKPIE